LGSSPYMTKRIPASHRGRIFSTRTIIAGLIGSISQLAIGFLLEKYTYNNVFIIYIVLGLICGVIYWLLIKKDKEEYPKLYNS
ncbi:MAG: MFS transporter, partial [Bacilli bacterium]